jgi:hypothetical protein
LQVHPLRFESFRHTIGLSELDWPLLLVFGNRLLPKGKIESGESLSKDCFSDCQTTRSQPDLHISVLRGNQAGAGYYMTLILISTALYR